MTDAPTVELPPGLVEATAAGPRLAGSRCAACGRTTFPAADACVYCGGGEVERVLLANRGTLWGWTAVTAAPPGYEGPVPYGFGVVELVADGVRVITRLTVPDPSALAFGQAMRLVLDELGVWAFAPDLTAADGEA